VISVLDSIIFSLLKSFTSVVGLNVEVVLGNCKVSLSLLLTKWLLPYFPVDNGHPKFFRHSF
jgi:hypothetical protein